MPSVTTEAIQSHEQTNIQLQLDKCGSWTVDRKGAHIRIAMVPVLKGKPIQYSVKVKHRQLSDAASSIAEAIAGVNQFLEIGR